MESTLTSTPIGGGTSTVKKFYSVKTSQNSSGIHDDWAQDSNVSKLDTLLQDLKHERELTRENDLYKTEEYDSLLRDTKQYYHHPTNQTGSKYIYSKEEILTDNIIPVEERYNTYNSSSSSFREDSKRDTSKNSTLTKNYSTSTRQNLLQSDDVIQSEEFKNLQLSEDILPLPGTKVTTTVRTYTYEVPTDGTINRDVVIKDVSTHSTNNTSSQIIRGRTPIPIEPEQNSKIYSYEEHINKSSNQNYAPSMPNTQKTVKYTATSTKYVDENVVQPPPQTTTYITKQHQQQHNMSSPHLPRPGVDFSNTYYYNSSSESNNYNSYPQAPPQNPPNSIEYRVETTSKVHNVHENPPYGQGPMPMPTQNSPNNSVVTYKYTTHTTTNHQGQPVRMVQPFPVYDENDGPEKYSSQPPKHLNELLTNLNGTNTNGQTVVDGYNPKLEVETAVAKENGNKVIVPSKNIAGPPVYYPPNHEMTLRRDEKSAAWRAGGGWARARGEYEYEAESKSKSKSKSGGAVVPVCLPLCCAMPCSIM